MCLGQELAVKGSQQKRVRLKGVSNGLKTLNHGWQFGYVAQKQINASIISSLCTCEMRFQRESKQSSKDVVMEETHKKKNMRLN